MGVKYWLSVQGHLPHLTYFIIENATKIEKLFINGAALKHLMIINKIILFVNTIMLTVNEINNIILFTDIIVLV